MTILLLLLFCFGSITPAQSKGWRGIEPLISTRGEVEGLLGKCTQPTEDGCIYENPTDLIVVIYNDGVCEQGWPFGYRVPVNTVIRIEVSPKAYVQLNELPINLELYRRNASRDGSAMYTNTQEGIGVEVFDKKVGRIIYGPSKEQAHLRCPDLAEAESKRASEVVDVHSRLYEYGDNRDETMYLDAFAKLLLSDADSRGYIIAYGGKESIVNEARKRLQCQMDYLTKRRGIPDSRVSLIDGGFRETRRVELYVLPRTGPSPLSVPTVRPSHVRFIGDKTLEHRLLSPCLNSP